MNATLRKHLLVLFLATPGLAASTGSSTPLEPVMSKEALFDVLGFDASERDRVMTGEIVTRGFEELSDKELSISMAMIVPAPMDRLLGELRVGGLLEHDRKVLSYGVIHGMETVDRDLGGLELGSQEAAEVDGLLNASPGSRFNLDASEYAGFEALRRRFPSGRCASDGECSGEVVAEYRRILKRRITAYMEHGLDGVASYARAAGEPANPGQELKTAAAGLRPISDRSRQLFQSFRDYPHGDQTLFEHQFLWLKQVVQDRPTVALLHRCRHVEDGFAFLAERQYYVGHSYNSLQVVAGLVPLGGKTIIFYLNRTSTDQVAGLMQSTRHGAGRRIMAKEIRDHFEQLRTHLQK